MQTREQKYAMDVYTRVAAMKETKQDYKSYGAMAHKLPILIHTAGLAQALAFVDARGNKAHENLLNDLAATVEKGDKQQLLKSAREAGLSDYMRLTQQVMAALLWYKRFAQSVLGVDATEATMEDRSSDEQPS